MSEWPPQAAGALKIALLGAHGEHVPRGALKELDHSTLLLLLLSVLCRSHLQAIPRPCGGIEQRLDRLLVRLEGLAREVVLLERLEDRLRRDAALALDEMVDEASKKITKLADEKKRAIETRQD